MLLGIEICWEIQVLLTAEWRTPSTGLELIVLPADAVVVAGELLFRNLTVYFDHGALHVCDVVELSH